MIPLLLALETAIRRHVADDFTLHHIPGELPYQSTVRILTPGFTIPPEARALLEDLTLNTVPAVFKVTLEYPDEQGARE